MSPQNNKDSTSFRVHNPIKYHTIQKGGIDHTNRFRHHSSRLAIILRLIESLIHPTAFHQLQMERQA